jgi:hypothetical protein
MEVAVEPLAQAVEQELLIRNKNSGFSGFTPSEYMKQRGDFLNYIPVK